MSEQTAYLICFPKPHPGSVPEYRLFDSPRKALQALENAYPELNVTFSDGIVELEEKESQSSYGPRKRVVLLLKAVLSNVFDLTDQ